MYKFTIYAMMAAVFLLGSFEAAAANPLAGYALSRKVTEQGREKLPGALIEVKDAATNLPAVVKVKTGTPIKNRTDAFYASSIGDVGRWAVDVKPGRYLVTISSRDAKAETYTMNLNAAPPNCSAVDGYLSVLDCGATQAAGNDDTQAIVDAMAAMAGVNGGKLYFPKGIYEVGTNSSSVTQLPIAIPFGVTVEGVSGGVSGTSGNCRINLGGQTGSYTPTNKAIFLLGENNRHITIKDIVLEASRAIAGSSGILAEGDYPNSSFDFLFSNMSISGFDIGFNVRGCKVASQVNGSCQGTPWQFDNVKADHVSFVNNNIGLRMDTNNTDWNISSSWFYMVADSATEPTTAGLYIQRGGFIEVNNTFGGYTGQTGVGGNFIYAANLEGGALQIINSQAERIRNSIVWGQAGTSGDEGTYLARIVITGSEFGAPIRLRHRINFISTGNHYADNNVISSTSLVRIYSLGDKFCDDGYIGPNTCTNAGFQGGTVVFSTGQTQEATSSSAYYNPEIPNRFGLPVEIKGGNGSQPALSVTSDSTGQISLLRLGPSGYSYDFGRNSDVGILEINGTQAIPYRGVALNGVLQLDPNMTYSNLVTYGTSYFNGVPVVKDGALLYCKDCEANSSTGVCQLASSNGGALAKRINGVWKCN